jgi:hypothetical protein
MTKIVALTLVIGVLVAGSAIFERTTRERWRPALRIAFSHGARSQTARSEGQSE